MHIFVYVKRCRFGIFFFIILFLAACSSYEYVNHDVKPADRFLQDVYSVRAVRRTLSCTVGAEFLNSAQIARLGRLSPFTSSTITVNSGLQSDFSVFAVSVSNVSSKPVVLGNPWVQAGGVRFNTLQGRELSRHLKGTVLANLKASPEVSWYRTGNVEHRFDHLDAAKLAVYDLHALMPDDTLYAIFVAQSIPLHHRVFSLMVPLTDEKGEKVIELKFMRSENRKLERAF